MGPYRKFQLKGLIRIAIASFSVALLTLVLAATPAVAEFAYATTFRGGAGDIVDVIDTATNTLVTSVPVQSGAGGSSIGGVAATPDGTAVYVVNFFADSVSVIATSTNTVVATVMLPPGQPIGVAITPDGTRAYVTVQCCSGGDFVAVIDTDTTSPTVNTVVATVNDPRLGQVRALAITPDGTRAYVAQAADAPRGLAVIDTAPTSPTLNSVVGTVSWEGFVSITSNFEVAITPDGSRAYVTDVSSPFSFVTVVDTDPVSPTLNTILARISVPSAIGIAITPDGTRAYAAGSGFVAVIDTDPPSPTFNTLLMTVNPPTGARGDLAITPDGSRVYVVGGTGAPGNTTAVISTASNMVVATAPPIDSPGLGIAIAPAAPVTLGLARVR
jgi:YVTN family beta-propeller protein